jgi:hypothetical protein
MKNDSFHDYVTHRNKSGEFSQPFTRTVSFRNVFFNHVVTKGALPLAHKGNVNIHFQMQRTLRDIQFPSTLRFCVSSTFGNSLERTWKPGLPGK